MSNNNFVNWTTNLGVVNYRYASFDREELKNLKSFEDTDDIKEVAKRVLIILQTPQVLSETTKEDIICFKINWKTIVTSISQFMTKPNLFKLLSKGLPKFTMHNFKILQELSLLGQLWCFEDLQEEQIKDMQLIYEQLYENGLTENIKLENVSNCFKKNLLENTNFNSNKTLQGNYVIKYDRVIFIDHQNFEYDITHEKDEDGLVDEDGDIIPGNRIQCTSPANLTQSNDR